MKKETITLTILTLFLISVVSASYGYGENGRYYEEAGYNQQERNQIQNNFENKYQYQCKENQTCYYDGSEDFQNIEFKIREMKQLRFLRFNFNVNMEQEYILNDKGEIIQQRKNIWSRLFRQEGVE